MPSSLHLAVVMGTLSCGCHLVLGFDDGDGDGAGGNGATTVTSGGASSQGAGGTGGAGQGAGGTTSSMGGTGGVGGAGGYGGMDPCPGQVLEATFYGGTGALESDSFDNAFDSYAWWDADYFVTNAAGHSGSSEMSLCSGFVDILPGPPMTGNPRSGFYWGDDQQAPYLHQRVTGDFAFELQVKATNADVETEAPADPYSGAGIVVYDPSTGAWILQSLGIQAASSDIGTRVYSRDTVGNTPQGSEILAPNPAVHSARLAMCRIGTTFHTYRRMDQEPTIVMMDDPGTYGIENVDELEVGFTVHWYQGSTPVRGRFEEATFHAGVSSAAECQALLQ